MELAIPLVALGGLYLISNQKKEGFVEGDKFNRNAWEIMSGPKNWNDSEKLF